MYQPNKYLELFLPKSPNPEPQTSICIGFQFRHSAKMCWRCLTNVQYLSLGHIANSCLLSFPEKDPNFWSPKAGQKAQLKFMKRNEQFLSITAANNQKYPGGDESHLKVEENRTEIKILQEYFNFRVQLSF